MLYSVNKTDVAQFVNDLLVTFGSVSLSITITNPGMCGEFFVSIVTDSSSEDTVRKWAQTYSLPLTNILHRNTPAG